MGISSSPPSSPEGSPPFYVQIPTSSDDSSNTQPSSSPPSSFTSQSPMESPIHSFATTSSTSFGISSDTTSQSSLRIGRNRRRRDTDREWMECNTIEEDDEEEELGEYRYRTRHDSTSNHYLIPILGFVSVVSIFCLVLWGISRPIKTHVLIEDFGLHKFQLGLGSDHTGITTTLLNLNTSLKVSIYNPATFFGIHVTLHPLLLYSGIPVATTNVRYYQPRKSRRAICANVEGNNIPLYGAAGSFTRAVSMGSSIPLTLEIHIQSLGKVFWTLVKAQHRWNISCPLSIRTSANHQNSITFTQNSCQYR